MSPFPEPGLSPATVEAIRNLFELRTPGAITDSALLRIALGVADEATRLDYARAALASPEVRLRLLRARESVRAGLEEREPEGEVRDDLGRLAVFSGSFTREDAAAVFPERFGMGEGLEALFDAGWLVRSEPGLRLAERIRGTMAAPEAQGPDAGWPARFVLRSVEWAERIERTLSEGLWAEASAALRARLPDLRAAWGGADRLAEGESAARLARALVPVLMELGERDALGELLAAGYRAAETAGDLALRSWLLSYEGAEASYRGDSATARALWHERLALARRRGNLIVEADTLLDLVEQASTDGDGEECRRLLDEAEPVVHACGRTDYVANYWGIQAIVALREGDTERASVHDERAVLALGGVYGETSGLFVRMTHARVLVATGKGEVAIDLLADLLERSIEVGRPVDAASVLMKLSPVLESLRLLVVAERCLAIAESVHRAFGVQRLSSSSTDREGFRKRWPEMPFPSVDIGPWHAEAKAVLSALREGRGTVVTAG